MPLTCRGAAAAGHCTSTSFDNNHYLFYEYHNVSRNRFGYGTYASLGSHYRIFHNFIPSGGLVAEQFLTLSGCDDIVILRKFCHYVTHLNSAGTVKTEEVIRHFTATLTFLPASPIFMATTTGTVPATSNQGRNGNSRRGRGRGGRQGGGQRRKNEPKATPIPAASATEPAEDTNIPEADAQSSVDPESVCWICAEPVRFYSVSECNHRTCHVCALRLRALYKRMDCTFCKVRTLSMYKYLNLHLLVCSMPNPR